MGISRKWRYRNGIVYNNNSLSILCHVVYATMGISIVLKETDESTFWLEFIIDEQLMKTNLVAPLLTNYPMV